MQTQLVRAATNSALRHAAGKAIGPRRAFDLKFGLALLRERRVPLRYKVAAIAAGAGLMLLLQAIEFPLETLLALLAGPLGVGLELAFDGAEAIALPILLGGALLPRIAPRELVETLRAERDA